MTLEEDQDCLLRAVFASRFAAEDLDAFAELVAQSGGPEKAEALARHLQRARDRLRVLAAGCDLAACAVRAAVNGVTNAA